MEIVTRFLSFDKLMGASLVKIVYFLGLIGIALGLIGGVFAGVGAMGLLGFFTGLTWIIASLIGCLFAVCFLRFGCELYMALFRMADDISAIRSGGAIKPPTP